ncbi:sigma-70 family RNA polymerase sigma factor [Muricauda oceani]|uniref:Sigma-70 family RNA polymerase sigma factor n=1 Tax=Flagellimonas oceani TaxID=2698672 RepID=A0A6G7IZX9_9FLAO|nr:sigma-70 family RNA polymerase sigma factor [Allomuricauda oceani]MBW8244244.1 sigma-70 family RNA polymerase sigma factor [Allomuricauda oceani]QII44106.1 sigma-70 family RNA polymerase sigma factor [Allomuricauda oceani]
MQRGDPNNLPSEVLFEMFKYGNELAYQVLFDRLWERMYVLAFSLLQDRAIAKDLVQEVWIDFWERKLGIENRNIEAFLLQATRFKVYKFLRDSKTVKFSQSILDKLQLPSSNDIISDIEAKETKSRIDDIVEGLPPKCRQVFVLSRYQGLGNAEISEILNISKRTVETHVSNALSKIKEELAISLFVVGIIFF